MVMYFHGQNHDFIEKVNLMQEKLRSELQKNSREEVTRFLEEESPTVAYHCGTANSTKCPTVIRIIALAVGTCTQI